ncbi:hypothetical protein I7I50_03322 [Histoplasma capsulatum G186AR]|uniref:Uncharacterized protein n=1 Tax=Ajellomyces capsulatus TaxID=5037 RepID=A0A8H7Z4B1_AJECA|nr:hypothetical protein I7I52_00009 [Histoplasma capsulatum]QSS72220.1 hypothetical protein I7I50_03322 [Histoplasma capsulatum G186AR]
MTGALKRGVRELENWVKGSVSRATRLARGEGTAGTRAAPTQTATNDSQIGVRLDNAEKITRNGKEYKRYKLQANKNAANPTIRELANKNSHRVFAEADVPLDGTIPTDQKITALFQDLIDDVDKNMKS